MKNYKIKTWLIGLFCFVILNHVKAEQSSINLILDPCIKVNGNDPVIGKPNSFSKCTNATVLLSVNNCGTGNYPISYYTFSWVNITSTSSFIYTTPTVTTSEAGRWIVTVTLNTGVGSPNIVNDTLDLINFAPTPFSINNNVIASHCPFDSVLLSATVSNLIQPNSYKWFINSTPAIDTISNPVASTKVSWKAWLPSVSYVVALARDINGCRLIANISAPLLPTPINPGLSISYNKCPGASITLTAAFQTGNNYSWDGGPFTTVNTLSTNVAGKHYVTVQRGVGCKIADTTLLVDYALPIVDIGADTSICYLETGQLRANVKGFSPYTYAWTPSGNLNNASIVDPIISLTTIGAITVGVTVTDGRGCSATVSKIVTHLAQGSNPYLNVNVPVLNICAGEVKPFNTTVSATYSTTYTFQWTPSTYLSSTTIANPNVDLNGSGLTTANYNLTVTDAKGCYMTVSAQANLYPSISVTVPFSDTLVCLGNTIQLQSNYTGGTGAVVYAWTPIDNLSNSASQNTDLKVLKDEIYTVKVTDANACSSSAKVTVKSINSMVNFVATDTLGYSVEPMVLKPNVSNGTYNYNWFILPSTTSVSSNTSYTATTAATYKVTIIEPKSKCQASDSINVTFQDGNPKVLYVPNVINPKSANVENQTVKVYGMNIPDEGFDFKIYNKWGELVYETNSFNEANTIGWNGKYKGEGQDQSQSVFTYVLQGKYYDYSDFKKSGTITVLR